ncbi:galactose oxidase [Trametopsis cervina]|nr:galactose oxidase [Trametopsis cervina]
MNFLFRQKNKIPQQRQPKNTSRKDEGPLSQEPDPLALQRVEQRIYPWSERRVILPPPVDIMKHRGPPPTTPSPSPFPRYGHAGPAVATATGELYLFGGRVEDSAQNDLYMISTRDAAATLVYTAGDVPSPRVSHAGAVVGSVLVVWGGDTRKRDSTDELDDGLYLLNLGSGEWTRVSVKGSSPTGRYGHAVCTIGSKFYVFGGQRDGSYLNDLWAFDLQSLRTTPVWNAIEPVEGSPRPVPRTGHACVAHDKKIFVFGGTDSDYCYNDTWVFDTVTHTWSELVCIGFIPTPREGHAAAIVDDVIYIFGGRDMDGRYLSDLGALKLSQRRWYMFRNMGPTLSPRSGHIMASMGSQVYVLGGMGEKLTKTENDHLLHVLDTERIRYPSANVSHPTDPEKTSKTPH